MYPNFTLIATYNYHGTVRIPDILNTNIVNKVGIKGDKGMKGIIGDKLIKGYIDEKIEKIISEKEIISDKGIKIYNN
jgi:hypothetical protein